MSIYIVRTCIVLLAVVLLSCGRVSASQCSFNGSASYLQAIQNGSLDDMIRSVRTELRKISYAGNAQDRKVVFTHVPKSAGTSVKNGMKQWSRFHSKGHVVFNRTDVEFNQGALHFTIIRKPSARVISLFAYINMYPHINNIYAWNMTHQYAQRPLEWIKQPMIQTFLSDISVQYFGYRTSDLIDMISAFRHSFFPNARYFTSRKIPGKNELREAIVSSNEGSRWSDSSIDLPALYSQYSDALCLNEVSEQMRCERHANAAFLLMHRYSTVGILEDYANVWKVMTDRVALPPNYARAASTTSRNTHKQSMKKSTETPLTTDPRMKREFESAVEELLFCENVVYEISKRIHTIDLSIL